MVEALKAEAHPDPGSIKAAQERVRLWKRERRWFLLLTEVANRIDANPYPGRYCRLRELVCSLAPEINQREWGEIFYWFGINNDKIYLPVGVDGIDIESIEEQLLALMNEDNVIPASSLEKVIQYSPNSKQYRNTKQQLEQRGWSWNRRRRIPTSIITSPYVT